MIFCAFQTADKVIVYLNPTSLMRINQKFCLSELILIEKEFKTSHQSLLVLCIISTFCPVVRKYSKRPQSPQSETCFCWVLLFVSTKLNLYFKD